MRKIIVLALTALLLLSSVFAQGQVETTSTYPEKGITMIVPYGLVVQQMYLVESLLLSFLRN